MWPHMGTDTTVASPSAERQETGPETTQQGIYFKRKDKRKDRNYYSVMEQNNE